MSENLAGLAYLIAAICFIMALRSLAHPETARRGNLLGVVGMIVAVVTTLLMPEVVSYPMLAAGVLIGGTIGTAIALKAVGDRFGPGPLEHLFFGFEVPAVNQDDALGHHALRAAMLSRVASKTLVGDAASGFKRGNRSRRVMLAPPEKTRYRARLLRSSRLRPKGAAAPTGFLR